MVIDLLRMNAAGEHFSGSDPAEMLEWDGHGDVLEPIAPVVYELTASILGRELLVRGSVRTRFGGVCVRCGEALTLEVCDNAVCLSVPLSEETQEVDLTPELREFILLALPSHPVCRPECPGVCPRCGRLLTGDACGCAENASSGWGALADLKLPVNGASDPDGVNRR